MSGSLPHDHPHESRIADEWVERRLSGEAIPIEPSSSDHDRERAADLFVVHALLAQLRDQEVAQAGRAIAVAMNRLQRPIQTAAWRRALPTAVAAVLVISAFAVWWVASAGHRAVADLVMAYSRQGLRRYELVVRRDDPSLPAVQGLLDLDGTGNTVVSIDLPAGAPQPRLLWGRSDEGWWLLRSDGTIGRSRNRSVVQKWLAQYAGGVDVPSVDDTLSRLEYDYDVDWSIDSSDGSLVYRGRLRAEVADRDANAATEVVFRYNPETARIRGVHWRWSEPLGEIARLLEVEARLIEKRPTTEGWFEPGPHLRDEPPSASGDRG